MVSAGLKVSVIVILAIMMIPMFSPLAAAAPRGKIISVTRDWYVAPNSAVPWSDLVNIGNESEASPYRSSNTTWDPYFENYTNAEGIIASPAYPPNILGQNITGGFTDWTIVQKFQLTASLVMDGVSETWLRLPASNLSLNSSITVRLWRSEVNVNNVSTISGMSVVFTIPSASTLIYNKTIDYTENYINCSSRENSTYGNLRWLNVTISPTYKINFTYFKMCAPLFPNECYFIAYTMSDPDAERADILITNSDMFEDTFMGTWMNWNASYEFLAGIETDYSMVFTKGLSNGITGTPTLPILVGEFNRTALSCNISYSHTVVAGDYLNVILPVVTESNASFPISVYITLRLWNTAGALVVQLGTTRWINSTQDRIIYCPSIGGGAPLGQTLASIQIVLYYDYNQTNRVHWYLQAPQINAITDMFYWYIPHPGLINYEYTLMYHSGFSLFGHIYIDSSYWTTTDYSIVVLPVEHPATTQGIVEAYEHWKYYITAEDDEGFWTTFSYFLLYYFKAILKGDLWWDQACEAASDFLNWLFGPGSLLSKLWNFIAGIGHFISQVITFVVEALEWFSYWGVRLIYAFSIGLVYMVNVYAVISINTGLLALARSGNGKDLIRAFNTGWKFILAIITLMLSLMIMAISIVSAVVPF